MDFWKTLNNFLGYLLCFFSIILSTEMAWAEGLAPIKKESEQPSLSFTEQASLLAGISVPSELPEVRVLQESTSWLQHQKFVEESWDHLERTRLQQMTEWSKTELSQRIESSANLWYLFGGPDFLTVSTLYPDAQNYILSGLEPLGYLPKVEQMTPDVFQRTAQSLRESLHDIFKSSFFITKEMMNELHTSGIRGVIPLLCFFAVRSDFKIDEIQYLQIDQEGRAVVVAEEGLARAVRISLKSPKSGKKQTLYYLRYNLEDRALEGATGFYEFVSSFSKPNSFLKSASYLMHNKDFSIIREFITAHSITILQDDSGIPLRYFQGWSKIPYGNYETTISDFKWAYQPDLRRLYEIGGSNAPRALPFKTGYGVQKFSNMLFVSKERNQTGVLNDLSPIACSPYIPSLCKGHSADI